MATILRAEKEDARALSALARASKAHWGYPEEWLELWNDELTIEPDYCVEHEVWKAVDAGAIVGCVALERQDSSWSLEHMWIRPDRIREGLGARLFEHAVTRARELGIDVLRILSDPNAEEFYRSRGAEFVGNEPGLPEGRELPVFRYEID